MRTVRLIKFFRAFSDSPHHIAAVEQLQDQMPIELLDKLSDWVVCFEAENEADPYPVDHCDGFIIDKVRD